MKTTSIIYQKLEAFIKKYYTNELIKGILLFIGFGLLYFLFTLFVEYFLWLKPTGRTILFSIFIAVEVFLLARFIAFPLFKLFKFQKGIDYAEASKIIGNHFAEVNDKLTNFLQLSSESQVQNSELMLASIEQKANSLQPIPFGNAINFEANKKYLPLALIPFLLLFVFYISGNSTIISQSLNRVVHFNATFLPPAPFQFLIMNDKLQTEQHQDFIVKVKTQGKIVPENVMIHIGDESYFMESSKPGVYEFRIEKPVTNVSFYLESNSVTSEDFDLKVITVPSISNFEMQLEFPSYLKKKSEIIKGTGNAILPEGTRVIWKLTTEATQSIDYKDAISSIPFKKNEGSFVLSKNISQSTDYQIFTSNKTIKNYEKLNYQFSVIKDQFPTINVNPAPDSLKLSKSYVLGRLSDDYGLSKLQIIYYEHNKPSSVQRGTIPIKTSLFDQFVFSFPSNLPVVQGVSYDYYFEIFDNDVLHNFKSTKSAVFSNRVATDDEIRDVNLQQQNQNINGLQKSLQEQDKQFSDLDKLQKIGKEKESLEFKDQQKVNEFIKHQQKQDQMMKQFTEKMNENLDKFKEEKKDKNVEELQNRLDRAEKDLEKNEKLLDELKKLNEKLNNENLLERLEKFKQVSKNQTRNLEQLVELTKHYYVSKKAEQLANKLDKLSEKQEKLSTKEKENTSEKQKEINNDFDKIKEDLKDLKEENKSLKSPFDVPNNDDKQKGIDKDLNKALDNLQKQNNVEAQSKQKEAAKKMKEMAEDLSALLQKSKQKQLEEDAKMLRQILDNLLAYSLSQENVMLQFRATKIGSSIYNRNIKVQQNLKQQFKHIDDSLFALSLRNPKVGEEVTKEIGNVQYSINNALEFLTEVEVVKGLSHQQYAISASNRLADFLSNLFNNMQMQISGSGSGDGMPMPGEGNGKQLSDIIKKQKEIGDKMKEGIKKQNLNGKESGNSKDGSDGEGDAQKTLEIYKEQVRLREALDKELKKQGLNEGRSPALEMMKQLEKQLLNKGFRNENMQRILNIQQELLKLNNAIQQQGEDTKRQSETNKNLYNNNSNALPTQLLDYLNSIEILNRQSLPLRSNFNQKVQEYFNTK